jgi:hypothetical protein
MFSEPRYKISIKSGKAHSMSSWNRGGMKIAPKPKPPVISYYDLTKTVNVGSTYLEFLGTYIYSQKMNEVCNVYDPLRFISTTLKYNPQVKVLTQIPKESNEIAVTSINSIVSTMKFPEIQKYAASVFEFTLPFNSSLVDVLNKASIKTIFDIGLHITTGASGEILPIYTDILRSLQKKSKKATLNVYVMADSYAIVQQFQKLCDPSWKITSLSKTAPKNESEAIIQKLAEVKIFAALNAAVLDFSNPVDKFIYLMNRNPKGYDIFVEVNGLGWSML